MSYDAQAWARQIQTGNPTRKAVLMNLANRANDEHGSCFPSQRLIAHETEFSERAVRDALVALEEMNLIRREKRYDKTDLIFLLMPPPGGVRAPAGGAGLINSNSKRDRQEIPHSPAGDSGDERQEIPGAPARDAGEDRQELPTNLHLITT